MQKSFQNFRSANSNDYAHREFKIYPINACINLFQSESTIFLCMEFSKGLEGFIKNVTQVKI